MQFGCGDCRDVIPFSGMRHRLQRRLIVINSNAMPFLSLRPRSIF
jgi:hypothetical protein